MKFIHKKLLVAQTKQKEYVDQKVKDMKFIEGEQVLLKVSHINGVIRFGNRGKLSLRHIVPFEVFKRVGELAYELVLHLDLFGVNPVFHVSMLNKYYDDGNYIV